MISISITGEEVQSGLIFAGGLILTLIDIGESAVNALIEGLEHRNILVRAGAATALGEIGDKRAVMPLIKALEDEDSGARRDVAIALGEIGDKRAVMPLIKALGDEDYNVQGWAAGALGKIGDRRAVKPLVKLLKASEEVAVRNAAEGALEKLGTSR